jgi:hypothetical protein
MRFLKVLGLAMVMALVLIIGLNIAIPYTKTASHAPPGNSPIVIVLEDAEPATPDTLTPTQLEQLKLVRMANDRDERYRRFDAEMQELRRTTDYQISQMRALEKLYDRQRAIYRDYWSGSPPIATGYGYAVQPISVPTLYVTDVISIEQNE